jgi:hypothetical protein
LIQEPDGFHHEGTKDTKRHSRNEIPKISRKADFAPSPPLATSARGAKKWEINGEILAEKKLSATQLYKDLELLVTNLPILVTDSLITDY